MKLLLEYEEEFCRRYYQADYIFVKVLSWKARGTKQCFSRYLTDNKANFSRKLTQEGVLNVAQLCN